MKARRSEDHKEEQRAIVLKALSRFKPRDSNPRQFYNCVRELCIMHNCSVEEGLERAALTWPGLTKRQREIYDSKRHAELPIPVPPSRPHRKHPTCKRPAKSLKVEVKMKEQPPNRKDPPKVVMMRVLPNTNRKVDSIPKPTSPGSGRARSPSRIPKMPSSPKIKKARSRHHHRGNNRAKKQRFGPKSGKISLTPSGKGTRRRMTKSKARRLAKKKDLAKTYNSWEQAVAGIRRRLRMH